MNASWKNINYWNLLKNADKAALCIHEVAKKSDSRIGILVDEDCDGASSAAIAYNFLHRCQYPCKKELIFHQTKKVHGLSDLDLDEIKDKYDLLWVPDAGSNDYADLEYLSIYLPIIITDHHEAEYESSYAIVVNNQLCDYPNKQLSGAGVTWQVCRAIEDTCRLQYVPVTKDLMGLCAFGNISDMMDYHEKEIRAVSNIGLANLNNAFLSGMAAAHDYSIQKMNGLNYYSCAFYITPYVNCCFRSGTQEEKEFVVKALLDDYAYQKVESSKRGHKGEPVLWWEEAITIAERVKRRQTKLQNDAMEFLESQIQEKNLTENAIILCECSPDDIEASIVGLAANKIQANYQHPTLVLRRVEENGIEKLKGSGRNYSNCELQNMREICENTGLLDFAQGHEGAFGACLPAENKQQFIEATNEAYRDIEFQPIYWVDYIWHNTADFDKVMDIGKLNIYGQGIPESFVAIEDLDLSQCSVHLLSRDKNPTLKIVLPNDVTIMKFKSSEEEYEEFLSDHAVLTCIGTCAINKWNGHVTPQIILENMELREEWIF